jgi:hyperosmotically inducible protein
MKGFLAIIRSFLFTGLLLGGWFIAAGQDPSPPATARDNTKVNEPYRQAAEPTAGQQKDNHSDRDMSQQIRQSITKDPSLSSYAYNVKIISQDGVVTLIGTRSIRQRRAGSRNKSNRRGWCEQG